MNRNAILVQQRRFTEDVAHMVLQVGAHRQDIVSPLLALRTIQCPVHCVV